MNSAEKIRRIEKALRRAGGTHEWPDMQELLIRGDAQIFDNEHGCWVTEVRAFPRKRLLNVWVVAGELPDVMDIQEQVERYGLSQSCERMYATIRPGWKDIYPKHGWKKDALVISKELRP